VFIIDITSAEELKTFIKYSGRTQPLNMYVLQRKAHFGGDLDELRFRERQQVKEAMRVLSPHFSRAQVLKFDVYSSSSLPHIPSLYNINHCLSAIELRCDVNDRLDVHPPATSLSRRAYLRVRSLDIDGPNFMQLISHTNPPNTQGVLAPQSALQRLSVSNLHPLLSHLSLSRTLSMTADPLMFKLRYLKLDKVAFDSTELQTLQLRITQLELIDIDGVVVAQFFNVALFPDNLELLRIVHCSLTSVRAFPPFDHLILEQYNEKGYYGLNVAEELIHRWGGSRLTLTGCPGLTQDIFEGFGDRPGGQARCPNMLHLQLNTSPGFSRKVWDKMLRARWVNYPRMQSVQTDGRYRYIPKVRV